MTGDLHPALRRERSGSARRREADSGQNAVTVASHALGLGGRPAGLEEGSAEAFNDPAVSSPGSAGGRSGATFRFSSDERRPTVWLSGEHDVSTDLLVACTLDKAMVLARSDVVIDLSAVSFLGASTVNVILTARRVLAGQSRNLMLRAPSTRARRVIDICGLSDLLESE